MSRMHCPIMESVRRLLSAAANASLYGMEHPQVRRLVTRAYEILSSALNEREEFSLALVENELLIDGRPQEYTLFLDRFARLLSSRRIGHVRLLRGITLAEVSDFISCLAGHHTAAVADSDSHLQLGRLELRERGEGDGGPEVEEAPPAISDTEGFRVRQGDGKRREVDLESLPAREMDRMLEIYETVRRRGRLKIAGIIDMVSEFVSAFRTEGQALLIMAALRDADDYTFTHSTNVCILNMAQAISLGVSGQQLNDIGVAGMLHDIGKLFIPEEIITKNGKLSDDEFRLIRSHPLKGARYLLDIAGAPRLAIVNAFEHHLKFDLSGYPRVPAGWRQNLCSQMTTISDIFDALRTKRSYRDPLPLEKIVTMLREMSGSELHPVLTDNFLSILAGLTTPPSPSRSSSAQPVPSR